MIDIERLGTSDPLNADGHVTIYGYGPELCAVDIVPKGRDVTIGRKARLLMALEEFVQEKHLAGLDTKIENSGKKSVSDTFFIKVGVRKVELDAILQHLLEYFRQSGVMREPIVVNMLWYDVRGK